MHLLFEEKQYLGFNKNANFIRWTLAGFCFVNYFWLSHPNQQADVFLILGIAIMLISITMLFVLHLHTKVYEHSIILDSLWSNRRVKISLPTIVNAEIQEYNQYFLNNAAFNLHKNNIIKFYTRGNLAIQLTDKDGLVYLIGSQRTTELLEVIKKQIIHQQ